MRTLHPESPEEIATLIREHASLEILGFGSKQRLGHPVAAECRLSTRALTGLLLYEPDEMVISARAGTPLAEILTPLQQHGQRLAFEPPAWNGLLDADHPNRDQTLGGVIACNLSGSRRLGAGACRDHLLGFEAVNGRAERIKSGGRVVKNVTGYDLSKLMAGSHGTLAVLTQLTLRTVPLAEQETTLLLPGFSARTSTSLFAQLLGEPWEVVSAAWLPAALAAIAGEEQETALIRLEGLATSVESRLDRLSQRHSLAGHRLSGAASQQLWQALSDGAPLINRPEAAIWRISAPPTHGAGLIEQFPAGQGWLDWGGGLLWLAVEDRGDASADALRSALEPWGGHATLIRAREAIRRNTPLFQPAPPALAALQERIRESFDPDHKLNPGRMRRL